MVAAHDASFDNMPKHKSQRGFFMMIAEKGIIKDHNKMHRTHLIGWSSGRIQRAVRSTLAAEAYSCSEAMDNMFWVRAVLTELFSNNFDPKHYNERAQ